MPPLFRTDDPEKWGAGKGTRLSSAEVDLNFWDLHERIGAIESDPPSAVGIEAITVDEPGVATVHLSDSSSYQVALPVAAFQFKGEWLPATAYMLHDIVSVERRGLFMVLIPHTSEATFDQFRQDGEGQFYYKQLSGAPLDIAHDIGLSVVGPLPGDGKPLLLFAVARSFVLPAGLTGSRAHMLEVPESSLSIPLLRNGAAIGSIDFAFDAHTATFSFSAEVRFDPGDRLVAMAPAVQDENAADLMITLLGHLVV